MSEGRSCGPERKRAWGWGLAAALGGFEGGGGQRKGLTKLLTFYLYDDKQAKTATNMKNKCMRLEGFCGSYLSGMFTGNLRLFLCFSLCVCVCFFFLLLSPGIFSKQQEFIERGTLKTQRYLQFGSTDSGRALWSFGIDMPVFERAGVLSSSQAAPSRPASFPGP